MNKGVVMEIQNKSIIVMTPNGKFERIPSRNRHCRVGEEITYMPRRTGVRQPVFAAASTFVAAVMLCMMLFTGMTSVFADKTVVAYISIDINPSVEIGIDKREKVREIRGLNDKGLELVRNLRYSGEPLEEVTEHLLQKAEEMNIFASGDADVVIASAVVKEDAELDDELVSEHLKQQVLVHVVMKHPEQAENIEVTAFAAPAEARETAKENGLSLGKYSVYLNAKSVGNDVKVEDLQKNSIHNIAKEAGGIDKLVDQSKLQKESIKDLLKKEKEGLLDKKVKEKKEANQTSSPKPSQKTSGSSPSSSKTPASSATPRQTPTPSASNKTVEPSRTPDKKDDDKKNDNKKNDQNDNKNNGNGVTSPVGQDEDRKTSGPSKDSRQPTPVQDQGNSSKDDKDERKNEKKDEKKIENNDEQKDEKKDDKR